MGSWLSNHSHVSGEQDVEVGNPARPQGDQTSNHCGCIFKVEDTIGERNPKVYDPELLSVGPIHNGCYPGIEDKKQKLVDQFLDRHNLRIEDIHASLSELQPNIRSYYATTLDYNDDTLVDIILKDACFVIQFIQKFCDNAKVPPFQATEVVRIMVDLAREENQIPFCVLEKVYIIAGLNVNQSFLQMIFKYFTMFNDQEKEPDNISPLHIPDLLRYLMLPTPLHREMTARTTNIVLPLYGANDLFNKGLKFKVGNSKCRLDLKFRNGVLTLPRLILEKHKVIYMRNTVIFEQTHYADFPFVAEYLLILRFLASTQEDVNVLITKKIILNWLGDSSKAWKVIDKLTRDLLLRNMRSDYCSLCDNLNSFGASHLNRYKQKLKRECFTNPWVIVAPIIVGFILFFFKYATAIAYISWLVKSVIHLTK